MAPLIVYVSDQDGSTPHNNNPGWWLHQQGYQVEYIMQNHDTDRKAFLGHPEELPAVVVESKPGALNRLKAHYGIYRAIKARRACKPEPDFWYIQTNRVLPGVLAGTLGLAKERLIYHTQDFLEPGRHPWHEWIERQVARRAGLVATNQSGRSRFMASHYGLDQVPIAVPTALVRDYPVPAFNPAKRAELITPAIRERSGTREPFLVLHIGMHSPVRCTQEIYEAFSKLPPHFVLVMTGANEGTKSHKETLDRARAAGTADRVVILGRLDFKDLLEVSAACDLGLLFYVNDGVGNYFQCPGRLTQFVAVGTPILASDHMALEVVVLRHNLGAVCRTDSPESIRAALLRVDAAMGDSNRQATRERIRKVFSEEMAYEHGATEMKAHLERRA